MTIDLKGKYHQGTGRRKAATARVRLYPGDGQIVVNDKALDVYFGRETDRTTVRSPLNLVGLATAYGVSVRVSGGGSSGQADAAAHGVALALLDANPDLRTPLRKAGFLTRDPREKERKKAGLKRARKAPQYTKR
jgi:small subunit ribosomal protein S9